MQVFIGIDPGASGGITAMINTNINKVLLCNPFKDIGKANEALKLCKQYGNLEVKALIEFHQQVPLYGFHWLGIRGIGIK